VPDWSHIIIAGHSQGGGSAAFLAMKLPTAVYRALLFSSPQDYYTQTVNGQATPVSAGWITGTTSTPLASFWGLRNANEGALGDQVKDNWRHLGAATGTGGLGGVSHDTESDLVDGSTAPSTGSQNFYIDSPNGTNLGNHCSTAMNNFYQTAVKKTWDWMLSGGGHTE